jgi:crossover junction endodeoxyribonuclease RusA
MVILELPFPVSVNGMFPSAKTGRRFLSAKGKAYRQEVYALALEQHGIFKPFTGPISVTVELYPPDKRIRDIDNYNKSLFDSLVHANVMMDDSQIKEHHCYMRETEKGGSALVSIEEL